MFSLVYVFVRCLRTQRLALKQNSNVSNVHGSGSKISRCKQILCDVRYIYFSEKFIIFDAVFLRLGGAQKISNTKKNPHSQEQPFSCNKRLSFKGGPQGPLPCMRTVNVRMVLQSKICTTHSLRCELAATPVFRIRMQTLPPEFYYILKFCGRSRTHIWNSSQGNINSKSASYYWSLFLC